MPTRPSDPRDEEMTIRYRSHAYTNETDRRVALEADVRRGLTSSPMSLPPKYFYDATGSKLFEDITELPEYYLTRTEAALLEEVAPRLMHALAPEDIVELGAGSATKTRRLLEARNGLRQSIRYVPIDIDEVTHVVNYELPNIPESYVRRIGRTARAGAEGIAISLCSGEERAFLRDIERLTRQTIPASDRTGDATLVSTAGAGGGERGHRHQAGGHRNGAPGNGAHKHAGHREGGARSGGGNGSGTGKYRGPQRNADARGGKGGGKRHRSGGAASAR